MIKWFVYIASLLILIPCLSIAKADHTRPVSYRGKSHVQEVYYKNFDSTEQAIADTTIKKNNQNDDKKKIKEVTKAKRLPKPEKVEDNTKKKPRRQRRPPGMERPPEIPRHNGD